MINFHTQKIISNSLTKLLLDISGMKHYPQYINNEKNIHIKKYSETKSRGQTPNPDIEALSPTVTNEDKKIRKLDINDLLAAIMVRMRRNEAAFHRKSSPTQETSFYYKESSVYSSNSKEENSGRHKLKLSATVILRKHE